MLSSPHIQSGSTPLWVASHNGHKDVVITLLRNGADVNLRFKVRTVLKWMYSSSMTGNNIFCHYGGAMYVYTLTLSCRVQDPLILPDLKDTLKLSISYNRRNRIVSFIVQVPLLYVCIYTVLWLLYVKVKVSERFSQTVYGCMWRTVKVDIFLEVLWVWGNHCSEDSIHCHKQTKQSV